MPGPGSANPLVANWSREIFYLLPNYVVVYDRSGIGSGVTDQFLAFHFPANPTAGAPPSGETRYDINYNGTYAGAITTVLPASATTTTNPMYPANDGVSGSNPVKVWQLQVRPPNSNANQMWLNVFDLAASSAEVATASKINVTAGAAAGTLLAAAGGNQAVLVARSSAQSPTAYLPSRRRTT